jgi:transposase InsO family protein
MTDAQLRKVWLDAGKPGIARFRAAAQRAGYPIKLAEARQFVETQATRQVFAPAPQSTGHVTAARLDDKWQADLIDFKQADTKQNNGFRVVLSVTDVLSRYTWAEPLPDKSAETVAKAFEPSCARRGPSLPRWTAMAAPNLAASLRKCSIGTILRTVRSGKATRMRWLW